MRYGTLCSGIDAPRVAWTPLEWKQAFCSEIEAFPCKVLNYHAPSVPNLGDMTKITKKDLENYGKIDLLCAGTPCQSFSVAGLRKGLDDPRGNLALDFLRIVEAVKPRWVIWENVPGVHSSWTNTNTPNPPSKEQEELLRKDGLDPEDFEEVEQSADFGCFTSALSKLGYGCAWRILDAQYFNVPQRRKRVFVIGYLGDWRRAAAVLFERSCLSGHPAPRREAGEKVAGCLEARAPTDGYDHGAASRHLIPETIGALMAKDGRGVHTDMSERLLPVIINTRQDTITSVDVVPPLKAQSGGTGKGDAAPCVSTDMAVRRLTPRECEKLQGFEPGYTRIPYGGKPTDACLDGPRYKALGNSMAVPVLNWLGKRIQFIEETR